MGPGIFGGPNVRKIVVEFGMAVTFSLGDIAVLFGEKLAILMNFGQCLDFEAAPQKNYACLTCAIPNISGP